MKLLNRNLRIIYYRLYKGVQPVVDEDGYETGESTVEYTKPSTLTCSVSKVNGLSQTEMFGNLSSYDRVIITDDMDCPINENSIIYLDTKPKNNGEISNDYKVTRVAKSLNSISYVITSVKTNG